MVHFIWKLTCLALFVIFRSKMETHLVLCLFSRRLANAGYPQAPYLGAFQSLNATSCRKRSASIARFPPRCWSHHKNKVISYTHPGNPDQRKETFNHNIICAVCIDYLHKRDDEGNIGCVTTVYVYLAQHEVQPIKHSSWMTINKA